MSNESRWGGYARVIGCVVVLAALASTRIVEAGGGKKPITDGKTKIVRAVNQLPGANSCVPNVIGTGNNPAVGPSTDLTNLSVSCSDNPAVTDKDLKAPLRLPGRVFCVTTLKKLRKQRTEVTVVADETKDNPYHCLLLNITPKQFVAAAREQD